jgi:hypothetical protein
MVQIDAVIDQIVRVKTVAIIAENSTGKMQQFWKKCEE